MSVSSMIESNGVTVSIATKAADTRDATGGRIEAWSTITQAIGFLQVNSVADDVSGGAERRRKSATLYLKSSPSVTVKDRVTHGGVTFEVTGVRTPCERPNSDALAYQIVDLVEVFG